MTAVGVLVLLAMLTFRPATASAEADPLRMTVLLEVTFDRAFGTCTGFMIGPHTIGTAGHCVSSSETGVARRVRVTPGINGLTAPFSSQDAVSFTTSPQWSQTEDDRYDFATITLGSDDLGSATGWFALQSESAITLRSTQLGAAGYPGNRPLGTQWSHTGSLTNIDQSFLYYRWNTTNGDSGGPIFQRTAAGYSVVGLVRGLITTNGASVIEYGVRMTAPVVSFFNAALAQPAAPVTAKPISTLFTVATGESVTLKQSGPPRTTVGLQSSTDNVTWFTLAAGATDATGSTSFTFTPHATLYYRTIAPGQPTGMVSRGVVLASGEPLPAAAPPAPAAVATEAPTAIATPGSTAAAAPGASAVSSATGGFDRPIAPAGVTAAVWSGGTTTQLGAALGAAGGISVTTFANGSAIVFIPGAPGFVNATFNGAFANGIPAGTIVLVVG